MKTQSTTVLLLLIVCAILAPLIAVVESTTIQVALIAVQLICLLLMGMNIKMQPPKGSGPTSK